MITFFTEMLELPNFGHMTASTIRFESNEKVSFLLISSNKKEKTEEKMKRIRNYVPKFSL